MYKFVVPNLERKDKYKITAKSSVWIGTVCSESVVKDVKLFYLIQYKKKVMIHYVWSSHKVYDYQNHCLLKMFMDLASDQIAVS